MEIILYLIPFIVSAFLLLFFKKETVWWEYIILIVPTILFIFIAKVIMVETNIQDVEYFGGYIQKVRHYDEWDEWIEKRCVKEVAVGKDSHGNTIYEKKSYDCSYRQKHPEYWVYVDNLSKNEHIIDKNMFEEVKNRFATPMVFVDLHRRYYRIDGDAQDYLWPNDKNRIRTITVPHTYRNKIKASSSIFGFEKISRYRRC